MNMLAELEYGNVLVKEEVAQIDSVLADKMDTALPNFQNTLTHKQQIGGYDELAWTITGFTFNGENYYLCMDVACYDGVWYNYEPGGLCGSYLGVDTYYAGVILQSEY